MYWVSLEWFGQTGGYQFLPPTIWYVTVNSAVAAVYYRWSSRAINQTGSLPCMTTKNLQSLPNYSHCATTTRVVPPRTIFILLENACIRKQATFNNSRWHSSGPLFTFSTYLTNSSQMETLKYSQFMVIAAFCTKHTCTKYFILLVCFLSKKDYVHTSCVRTT